MGLKCPGDPAFLRRLRLNKVTLGMETINYVSLSDIPEELQPLVGFARSNGPMPEFNVGPEFVVDYLPEPKWRKGRMPEGQLGMLYSWQFESLILHLVFELSPYDPLVILAEKTETVWEQWSRYPRCRVSWYGMDGERLENWAPGAGA